MTTENRESKETAWLEKFHKGNTMNLRRANITCEDMPAILQFLNTHPTITKLDISNNDIGDEGIKAFAVNETIQELDASYTNAGDEGVKALAANTTIQTLNIKNNKFGVEGLRALAANETLRDLNVSYNNIEDEGVKVLAKNTTIHSLTIRCNKFGVEGVRALAANSTIHTLDISNNSIGDEGVEVLAENKTIQELNISGNEVGEKGANSLVGNSTIILLNASYNPLLGNAGAIALAKNQTIHVLYLINCVIGDSGAEAFAKNTSIVTLHLSANQISDFYVIALAKNPTIYSLEVTHNFISSETEAYVNELLSYKWAFRSNYMTQAQALIGRHFGNDGVNTFGGSNSQSSSLGQIILSYLGNDYPCNLDQALSIEVIDEEKAIVYDPNIVSRDQDYANTLSNSVSANSSSPINRPLSPTSPALSLVGNNGFFSGVPAASLQSKSASENVLPQQVAEQGPITIQQPLPLEPGRSDENRQLDEKLCVCSIL